MRYLIFFLIIFGTFHWETSNAQHLCVLNDKNATQRGYKKLPEISYSNKEAKADSAFQLSICYYHEDNVVWKIWMLIARDMYKQSIVAKSKKYDFDKAFLEYKIGLCHYYLKEYKQAKTWLSNANKREHNNPLVYYYLAFTYLEVKDYNSALEWIKKYEKVATEQYETVQLTNECNLNLEIQIK